MRTQFVISNKFASGLPFWTPVSHSSLTLVMQHKTGKQRELISFFASETQFFIHCVAVYLHIEAYSAFMLLLNLATSEELDMPLRNLLR